MLELLGLGIGFLLSLLGTKWQYARQLLSLGQTGLELAKATGLDSKIPDKVRQVAEQAIIAANQRELESLVQRLQQQHDEGAREAAAALERGRAVAPPPENITIIEPDGSEPASSPWKAKQ